MVATLKSTLLLSNTTLALRIALALSHIAFSGGAAQPIAPRSQKFWLTGAALTAALLPLDERIRELIWEHHPALLDRIARPVGDAGNPRTIYGLLFAGAVLPRLAHNREASDAAIDVGLGYAISMSAGAVLRYAVGRHRPDSSGNALRFAHFRPEHEWHSLPSGHAIGVAALATGLSIKANQPWVNVATYTFASIVDLQRVYERKHWASDIIAGSVLGIALSASTVRWREHHRAAQP
jgi:membrane-associated phospholipid phosphatase